MTYLSLFSASALLGILAAGFLFTPPAPQTAPQEVATLLFVGDIMLDRNVSLLQELRGRAYPFLNSSELFKRFDTVAGNLEGTVSADAPRARAGQMRFAFSGDTGALLNEHNFSIVSVANNHSLDHGNDGYNETLSRLNGISVIGHPLYPARDVYRSVNGIRFRMIGLNATYPTFSLSESVSFLRKQKESTDWMIVFMHWGDEYALHSNKEQQEIAHTLIDSGADIIIGSHPHVTEEIEKYGNGIVFYSLGNFIFDQYFSKEVEEGLAVGIQLTKDTARFELIPINGNHSSPIAVTGEAKEARIKDILGRSPTLARAAEIRYIDLRKTHASPTY